MEDTSTSILYNAVCEPYCNINGKYVDRVFCYDNQPIFCCGTKTYRDCCPDEESDIAGIYPPATSADCGGPDWWVINWRILMALLCTMMIILLASTCCYYCCKTSQSRTRGIRRRSRRNHLPTVSSTVDDRTFDPSSPNAFSPPDYDSIVKDPPTYLSLFGEGSTSRTTPSSSNNNQSQEEGVSNSAFVGEINGAITQVEQSERRNSHVDESVSISGGQGDNDLNDESTDASLSDASRQQEFSIDTQNTRPSESTSNSNSNQTDVQCDTTNETYNIASNNQNTGFVSDNKQETESPTQKPVNDGFPRLPNQLALGNNAQNIVI